MAVGKLLAMTMGDDHTFWNEDDDDGDGDEKEGKVK